jgi:hypothetical protein
MKHYNAFFCIMTPCSLVDGLQVFRRNRVPSFSGLKSQTYCGQSTSRADHSTIIKDILWRYSINIPHSSITRDRDEQRGRTFNTLFHIREVPNSHLGPETGYHDASVSCFHHFFRASAGGLLLTAPSFHISSGLLFNNRPSLEAI